MKKQFALAASFVLALACEDPGKNAPAAKVEEPATQSAESKTAVAKEAEGATETLAINQDSAKLQFTGSKVTDSHTGSFGKLSGKITLAGGKAEGGAVSIEIDTRSVDIEPEKLENHLKSDDFFDVEKFPKATFESTKIEKGSSEKGATHTVTGNLNLRGKTKQITFPATIKVTSTAVKTNAKFSINRKDFDIVYKGMPDDLIRDLVVLELDVDVPLNKG
jgi:polyisoprenoid-binding protein YceI